MVTMQSRMMPARALAAALLLMGVSLSAGTPLNFGDWLQPLSRQAHDLHLLAVKAAPRPAFEDWVRAHGKDYASLPEEMERRFAIWQDNLEFAFSYNQRAGSHWVGLNALADLSHDEYRNMLGYRPGLREGEVRATTKFMYSNSSFPASIDWRKKGAVTKVKNQQQCGSCWSFSTTGSIEGINAIYTGNLTSLSEQELVDCDVTRDHGCHGGLMDFAFAFVLANGGLDTEEDYKYIAQEEKCSLRREHRHVVTIDGYQDVPPNNETALMQAVAHQPVSVAIEADQREFQLYNGGVFDGQCGTALDHGVLVVGYGTEGGKPYWLIKNSWGPLWGDSGYIKLVRNLEGVPFGQCGVAMVASFPVKKTDNPPVPSPTPPEPPTPPKPEPVACDATGTASCPAGSTCCCMRDFLGYCLSWACCPLVNAVCCEDHQHCCPHNLPVCDVTAGRCLSGVGQGFDGSVPWTEKQPVNKVTGRVESWISNQTWVDKLLWNTQIDSAPILPGATQDELARSDE